MNIYITLDYELFFGPESGTVDKCIIEPTEALLELVDPFGIKFVCFVDSGYLLALEKYMEQYPQLSEDYKKVSGQIRLLADNGHGIELHVHPHWEDTVFDGKKWVFDTSRYKLSDFTETEVMDIVSRYNTVLESITGKPTTAYRAGGWSAQPFEPIGKALLKNGISVDSTVYAGGRYSSQNQVFDFTGVDPYLTAYRFSTDLTNKDEQGEFYEIPISSYRLSPFFYWKFVANKFRSSIMHRSYGDGNAIPMSKKQVLRLMLWPSCSVVSIDGFKASFLERAFQKYKKNTRGDGNFVMIGHPKAFTAYSLQKLQDFISGTQGQHSYKIFK